MNRNNLLTVLFFIFVFQISYSQVEKPVTWKYSHKETGKNEYVLVFTAAIDAGWHMYGLNIPDGGPIPTSFNFEDSENIDFIDDIQPDHKPQVKYDNTFEMDVELFDGGVKFIQKITTSGKASLKGYIEFMACDDTRCLPPDEFEFSFSFTEETSEAAKERKAEDTEVSASESKDVFKQSLITSLKTETDSSDDKDDADAEISEVSSDTNDPEVPSEKDEKSLLIIFLLAIGGGLAAIITPCVFPIIPLTVSFFSRESKSQSATIAKALTFGLSIVVIYVSVGFISGLFKIDLMKAITSHWIPNLLFFLIFLTFAISFFGAFEIMLPNKWANKIDQKADKGGLLGSFFMALATTVISFSCTGIIAGAVLSYALQGDILTPVIGMLGFGIGFGFPFTLLAMFPEALRKLPKSGGWLNAVKVVFAFILLLFSLIFLGLLGQDLIPRDFILALAVIILILLGLYLIGRIKFSHDSDLAFISMPRIFLAILSWAFALYLTTGIFGAPLKKIDPFLPGKHTLSIDLTKTSGLPVTHNQTICEGTIKYADKLHLPHNLKGYFVWEEALSCARKSNKPVLVDFVGHSCKNCKKMYAEVWSDKEVQKMLRNDFVLLALYTDDRTKLPEEEWITSKLDGRVKKTMGKKNLDFQVTRFNSNALPMYVIVDPDGNILTDSKKFYTYSNDIKAFLTFLREGLANFN